MCAQICTPRACTPVCAHLHAVSVHACTPCTLLQCAGPHAAEVQYTLVRRKLSISSFQCKVGGCTIPRDKHLQNDSTAPRARRACAGAADAALCGKARPVTVGAGSVRALGPDDADMAVKQTARMRVRQFSPDASVRCDVLQRGYAEGRSRAKTPSQRDSRHTSTLLNRRPSPPQPAEARREPAAGRLPGRGVRRAHLVRRAGELGQELGLDLLVAVVERGAVRRVVPVRLRRPPPPAPPGRSYGKGGVRDCSQRATVAQAA